MRRPRDLFLPPISFDRRSSTPLHQQVGCQIARAICSGVPAGSRLPSSRLMARLLGVSRNTVNAVLNMLDAHRVLRQAQYPSRTLHVVDPDGILLYLAFR